MVAGKVAVTPGHRAADRTAACRLSAAENVAARSLTPYCTQLSARRALSSRSPFKQGAQCGLQHLPFNLSSTNPAAALCGPALPANMRNNRTKELR